MNDPLLNESLPEAERPPILSDEMFPGEAEVIEASTPDVNTFRHAFNALAWYKRMIAAADEDERKVLAKIDEEVANVRDFYARKREGADSRVAFWKGQLHAMMLALNVSKYATPYGTSFYKRVKRK
jgi:predicted phage tail protein